MNDKFLIIDTEGSPLLKEIAIVNDRGEVIYEKKVNQRHKLCQILQEVHNNCEGYTLVFHYAEHDRKILSQSYEWEGLDFPQRPTICTWELAKYLLPKLPNYSLEYLSKHLNLKVSRRRFNARLAHVARYDALFTYHLYRHLITMTANPFLNVRVDNPFQRHTDLGQIYRDQFKQLSHLLQEIRSEVNHQSQGVAVIGEAGSGKSHLMMRLAQTHIKTNRLLFISQPNNSETVFYHIYCCVLESLSQQVLETKYNQLEYLIANTFIRIIQLSEKKDRSVAGQRIIEEFTANPLLMYGKISSDGAAERRTWDYIEKKTLHWWSEFYGAGGFGLTILQGIIKFCRYRDIKKRETVRRWLAGQPMVEEELSPVALANWEEELSRENFALQALQVLGRLSILDEPLIFVFDQLEGLWLKHHQALLQSFGHVIKEFVTHVPNCLVILNLFPDRWQEFNRSFDPSVTERITTEVKLEHPGLEQLWQILQLRGEESGIDVEELFNQNERSEILSQPTIRSVLKRASQYFQFKKFNLPLPPLELVFTAKIDAISLEERVTKLEKLVDELQNRSLGIVSQEEEPSFVELFFEDVPQNDQAEPPALFLTPSLEAEIKTYIQQLELKLNQDYDRPTIFTESNDVGKLATIAEVFAGSFTISTLPLRRRNIPENLLLQWQTKSCAIGFQYGTPSGFANRIKNWNLLLPDMPDTRFILVRDVRAPLIRTTAKIGREEISKLNNSENGKFHLMDRADRIYFELCYRLIVDVQNRDLEAPQDKVIEVLTNYIPSYWLIQILTD